MWLDDLKTIIVAAGIPAASVMLTSQAVPSKGDGPFLSIIGTGGPAGERTQNLAGLAYNRPTAQIMSRAIDITAALDQLKTAFDACDVVLNQSINSVWYLEIRPLQSDFVDLGPDELGRARVAFNVLGFKRPS